MRDCFLAPEGRGTFFYTAAAIRSIALMEMWIANNGLTPPGHYDAQIEWSLDVNALLAAPFVGTVDFQPDGGQQLVQVTRSLHARNIEKCIWAKRMHMVGAWMDIAAHWNAGDRKIRETMKTWADGLFTVKATQYVEQIAAGIIVLPAAIRVFHLYHVDTFAEAEGPVHLIPVASYDINAGGVQVAALQGQVQNPDKMLVGRRAIAPIRMKMSTKPFFQDAGYVDEQLSYPEVYENVNHSLRWRSVALPVRIRDDAKRDPKEHPTRLKYYINYTTTAQPPAPILPAPVAAHNTSYDASTFTAFKDIVEYHAKRILDRV
uniref:Uncharacterized protein n=1 Tax=viral metagenome TaxID=1070528 RepID=A0A2V0RHR3_9ZZZZ